MVRSVLAVLGSLLVVMAAVFVATILLAAALIGKMPAAGPVPVLPPTFMAINLAYSAAFAVLGGWLCGLWAGKKPLLHAAALAGVMLALSLPSVFRPEPGIPSWYGAVIAVLGPAGALVGGWLRERKLEKGSAVPAPEAPPPA